MDDAHAVLSIPWRLKQSLRINANLPTPENKCKSTNRADYYTDWFETLEDAQRFVEQSKSK